MAYENRGRDRTECERDCHFPAKENQYSTFLSLVLYRMRGCDVAFDVKGSLQARLFSKERAEEGSVTRRLIFPKML